MPASWKGLLGRRLRLADLGRTRLVCRVQGSIGAFVLLPMRTCSFLIYAMSSHFLMASSLSLCPVPQTLESSSYKPPTHITHLQPNSRRSDIANERLPEFDAHQRPTIFPVPSMRSPARRSTAEDGMDMEDLIKRTLEEDADDGGVVERLAEKIARGRSTVSRPSGLKRHGTT